MRQFALGLAISCAALGGTQSYAAGLSGRYLVTLKGNPSSFNGPQYCATLVADGSTQGYRESGTVMLTDQEGRSFPGTWFADHGAASFEVPLPVYSNTSSFIVFSGQFGKPQITHTTVTEVLNGTPAFDGSFTAVKNGC